MRGRMLAALAGCGALALAGCAAPSSSSVTVSGNSLTIYISAPAGGADPQLSGDVVDAEQLAFGQYKSEVSGYTLTLRTLTARKPSDNARVAIQDNNAIAYLGEIDPHSSYASLGITNAADLLQVSPTDTALELTEQTSAVPGSPGTFYEQLGTYGRTFARMVPNTAVEAKAELQLMQSLHVKRLYVTDDGTQYGSAMALSLAQSAAPAIPAQQGAADPAKFASSGADALFMGGTSQSSAVRMIDAVAASNPRVKVFVPSALNTPQFAAALSPAAQRVTLTSAPGFLPADLAAVGKKFVSQFKATYHHVPASEAIFGYDAMSAVLAVLHEAGSSATNRSEVVHDFFKLTRAATESAVGAYSIDSSGDTSIGPFVFSKIQSGKLVPFKYLQVQG